MAINDPIADMLTRIRNAVMAGQTLVAMPSSKIKIEIAKILKDEGYLENFEMVDGENPAQKVFGPVAFYLPTAFAIKLIPVDEPEHLCVCSPPPLFDQFWNPGHYPEILAAAAASRLLNCAARQKEEVLVLVHRFIILI